MGCVTCSSSSSSRARHWETSLTVSYIEDSNMRSYSLAYYFSPVLYKTILPFYFFLSYISRRSLYISIMGGWGLCSVRTLHQCRRPLAGNRVISLSRNIVHDASSYICCVATFLQDRRHFRRKIYFHCHLSFFDLMPSWFTWVVFLRNWAEFYFQGNKREIWRLWLN